MVNTTNSVADQVEQLRQLVIAARKDGEVGPAAEECLNRLNQLHQEDPAAFTPEDIRFVNVLRGTLGVRIAAHTPATDHTKKAKRKGDKLDHCWRCQTAVDERFSDICPKCDSKAYHWRICPVCTACGCQREGGKLV